MTEIRLSEARDLFSRELTFPVDCQGVVEETGQVCLRSPTGSTETVSDVLGRCEGETFESNDQLCDALMTYLGEEFIGRKHYDDRGSNPQHDEKVSL